MKLMTTVNIQHPNFTLNFRDKGLVLGSCFAQHIGGHLLNGKMDIEVNPFGVIYNPLSIVRALTNYPVHEDELVPHNGLWHCMLRHGSFSGPEPQAVLSATNAFDPQHMQFDYIIITLGTTGVYSYKGEVVANCHKIPEAEFTRSALTAQQTVDALLGIRAMYPHSKIIYTLSPIRHIKDGLQQNALSKATLRLAIHTVVDQDPDAHYFPAYEIMMDELRDYRFYEPDMVHPSAVAVEYIIDTFCKNYLDKNSQTLLCQAHKLRDALNHRPLSATSEGSTEYRKFQDYIQAQTSLVNNLLSTK